ncbi:MAG: hypothetical protein LBK99_16575 [Opitutaceae bacterium]|jgi:hypothetical protein|nr:hypothetical protein [Opitutaceae bacterium]
MIDILKHSKPVESLPGIGKADIVVCEDDTICERLFIDAGVINLIIPALPCTRGLLVFQWREFHVVGLCFKGHANPADNGYTAFLMRRATVTNEAVAEFVHDLINPAHVTNVTIQQTTIPDPANS